MELQNILNDNKNANVEFRLSELLVDFETDEDKNTKIAEINGQIKKIGFDNAVLTYSKSLNKNNMGDIGWVKSESLSKNILKAIENLGINEVSNPIVSSNTILFIKITDKKVLKLDKKNIENLKKRKLDEKKN